ncbi:MAG: hypothetical protein WC714_19060 [Candidatus Obscuribacterales bacterium]
MPKGSKAKYTDKQKRMAEHIEDSYEEKGVSHEEAEARAWATVNKETGGGEKKGGSGTEVSSAEKKARRKSVAKSAASTRAAS